MPLTKLKKINGGIVLVENSEVIVELPLTIAGTMYDGKVEHIIAIEAKLKEALTRTRLSSYRCYLYAYYFYSQHIYHIFELHQGAFLML